MAMISNKPKTGSLNDQYRKVINSVDTIIEEKEDEFDSAIAAVGTNSVGNYEDDPTITNINDVVWYETTTVYYKLKEGSSRPYNIDSTTYPDPSDDPNIQQYIQRDQVLSIAQLQSRGVETGYSVYLSSGGNSRSLIWDDSDLSTEVALDTNQGLYVASSSDLTGASGAWVVNPIVTHVLAEWFGASESREDNQTPIMEAMQFGFKVTTMLRQLTINGPIDAEPYSWLEGMDSKSDQSGNGFNNPSTVITLADGSNCPMFRSYAAHQGSGSYGNCWLKNIRFDGNSENQTTECEHVQIKSVFVPSAIENVTITDTYGTGLSVYHCDISLEMVWVFQCVLSEGRYEVEINGELNSHTPEADNYQARVSGDARYCHIVANNLYVEQSRTAVGEDVQNDPTLRTRGGVLLNRVSGFHCDTFHTEYIGIPVDVEQSEIVHFDNIMSISSGNTDYTDDGIIRLKVDEDDDESLGTKVVTIGTFSSSGSSLSGILTIEDGSTAPTNFYPIPDNGEGSLYYSRNTSAGPYIGNLSVINELNLRQSSTSTGRAGYNLYDESDNRIGYIELDGSTRVRFGVGSDTTDRMLTMHFNGEGENTNRLEVGAPLELASLDDSTGMQRGSIFGQSNASDRLAWARGSGDTDYEVVPTIRGTTTSAPTITPEIIGYFWIDTSGPTIYMSTGTTSSDDWTALN